ncbi:hypothetical protein Tco_0562723 [Tanacetum coccineum]
MQDPEQLNFVVYCGKCVLNENHDIVFLIIINNVVNSRTKQPIDVPISTREPKRTVNQSVATPLKKTVALESTNQKPRSKIRRSIRAYNLEVAFQKSTCYVRDLKGNDLLTGSRGSDLYSITLIDTTSPNPICLMAKATSSQAWLMASSSWQLAIVRYGENINKMKEKGDACIFVGYSTQSRAYRVYNKRTKVIVETIHVNFDELPQMASDHVSFDPVPQCQTMALEHDSLSPGPQSQKNVPQAAETVTMSNELDLLFSLMFDELLNETTQVVSKSFVVTTADAPNQHQQQHTTPSTSTTIAAYTPPLNIQTTPETTSQAPTQAPTVTATKI